MPPTRGADLPPEDVMDDMEKLTAFRADVPDPPSDVVLRARRSLLRHAVGSRVAARRRRMRRVVATGIAAAVITGGAVVADTADWGGGSPVAPARAVELLHAAARTAGAEPSPRVADRQYIYIHRVGTWAVTTDNVTYLQPQLYEAWLPPDGSRAGRIRVTYRAPVYLSDGDAQRLQADGVTVPDAGTQQVRTIPASQTPSYSLADPSYAFLRTLPTDPDQLYSLISRYAQSRGVTPAQQMLDTVGSLLSWSIAPPPLRSALYEVAARIPGIEFVGQVITAAGQRGTALAVTAAGIRYELIFDLADAQLLGTRNVVVDDPAHRLRPGAVVADDAITISVVDALGVASAAS